MADPIRERILEQLAGTARGVTKVAGYEIDVRTVERVRRQSYHSHEYAAVNLLEGEERKTSSPGHLATCYLPVYMEISVWSAVNLASAANKAMAAVVKGVLADRTRGGLAVDTKEVGNRMFLDETDPTRPIGGFRVELSIEYRHVANDPYTSI